MLMKLLGLRSRFLYWLKDFAKVEEAVKPPAWITLIYYLLFPLRAWYAKQSGLRYDYAKNTLIIHGVNFSMRLLEDLAYSAKVSQLFRFVDRGERFGENIVTIERIREDQTELSRVPRGVKISDGKSPETVSPENQCQCHKSEGGYYA
jgi:hypothetical protein